MKSNNTKDFTDAMAIRRTDNAPDGLDAIFTPEHSAPTPKQKQRGVGKYAGLSQETNDGRKQYAVKLPVNMIEKIRDYSYWQRVEQWQFVADAIRAAFDAYEQDHGEIKPRPPLAPPAGS